MKPPTQPSSYFHSAHFNGTDRHPRQLSLVNKTKLQDLIRGRWSLFSGLAGRMHRRNARVIAVTK